MPMGDWLSGGLIGAVCTAFGMVLKPLYDFLLKVFDIRRLADEKKRLDEAAIAEKKRRDELDAEAQVRADEATARREELEAENARLKSVLDRLDNYYTDLRHQVATAADQIKLMQDNHMACEKALAAVTERLSGSEKHVQDLTGQLRAAETRIGQLEGRTVGSNPEVSHAQGAPCPGD